MKNLEDILWNNDTFSNDSGSMDDYIDSEVDPKGTVLHIYCLAICCTSVSGAVQPPVSTMGCR